MKFANLKHFQIMVIGGAIALLAGCAYQAPAISTSARPDEKSAILFGRFDINRAFTYESHLALWVQNLDTHKPVYIYFDQDQPVYGVKVAPGRYQVIGFVGVFRLHDIKVRRAFPSSSRFTLPFRASAGSEIYLGDFSGTMTYDSIIFEWRINSASNNIVDTTEEFDRKFPNLTAPPTAPWLESRTDDY
jgi:hypothetical protein